MHDHLDDVSRGSGNATVRVGRILASDVLGKNGWDILHDRSDLEAISFPNTIRPHDFVELLSRYDRVVGVILGLSSFRKEEIAAAPDLKVLARIGVGYDTIDIPALTRRGIPLMIVGDANATAVAEHALYMMLTLAKRGAETHALARDGRWLERMSFLPREMSGKIVLIVGFGRIGTRVAKRCLAMEANVIVYDPYVSPDQILSAGYEHASDLDLAITQADFVTLHCPKNAGTIGMFGAERLHRMKNTAYLINTARGGIADETSLYDALVAGDLAGAGVDVFETEPANPELPILSLPNVVTSPHLAGVTRELVARMAELAVNNILGVLDGSPNVELAVNPEAFFGNGAIAIKRS